jgi:Prolyl oligopeptidase family
VYAVPSLRGGGTYGEKWHEAGTLANKQNVFDDFAWAAKYLIAHGYTASRELGIQGYSNGELLTGASTTESGAVRRRIHRSRRGRYAALSGLQHPYRARYLLHLDNQRPDVLDETLAEMRAGVVIRTLVPADEAKGHRVVRRPLERAAGEHPRRIAVPSSIAGWYNRAVGPCQSQSPSRLVLRMNAAAFSCSRTSDCSRA